MRTEFNYPFFNGFFAKILAGVGPGYLINDKD